MPRTGLNVPIITVLDDANEIIEVDQRRVVRHVMQNGRGADSLFLSGTTGEFNRIANRQRQQLIEIGCDEIRSVNAQLPDKAAPIEAWANVTALTKAETLQNLDAAVQLRADLAVVAPLAIADLPAHEIINFFERDVKDVLGFNELPIGLYDNPEIAADPHAPPNIPLPLVEALSRLPFVVNLKASTSREVLQSYIHAFAAANGTNGFGIYVGNAGLIFELDDLPREAGIDSQEVKVAGVVAGSANLLPREWQYAWQAVVDRDTEVIGKYGSVLTRFDRICVFGDEQSRVVKFIHSVKQGMYNSGLISSPRVAPGTPALTKTEAAQVTEGTALFLEHLSHNIAVNTTCSK